MNSNSLYFDTIIARVTEKLNTYFDRLSCDNSYPKNVVEAMKYSVLNGGKRVRAILCYEFCKVISGDENAALSSAAALEMIHAFSLIHDDLPCMDDDDFRRGKPSCHKKYGEAIALLAGDALEAYAFEIIADDSLLSCENRIKLIKELGVSVGVLGMIGGQVIDVENVGQEMSTELLEKMYSMKTGALIKAACKMGAICGGASSEQLNFVEKYAENLGFAFQIIDDILDVVGDEKLLGKPIGSDAENNKFTYVTVHGVENSRAVAKKRTENALEMLKSFENAENLIKLTEKLLLREY